MKVSVIAALALYSATSMADYKCVEKDSMLTIKNLTANKAEIKIAVKNGSGTLQKTLKAQKKTDEPGAYYSVKQFDLKDSKGSPGFLKISMTPKTARTHANSNFLGPEPKPKPSPKPPSGGFACTHTRICFAPASKVEITAELDYQGKLTVYNCQEVLK
jgi:hypothetical protein